MEERGGRERGEREKKRGSRKGAVAGGRGMKGRAAQLLAAFPGFLASEVSTIRKKERFN